MRRKIYSAMPLEKRVGRVPRHGYCNGKPGEKYGEAMQIGCGQMSASIYGQPYEEQIVYGQEKLYLPTVKEVPPPPPLAGHMKEIRRLLAEGKTYEAADLASDIAREEGGHGGLLKKPENPEDWEIPIECFFRHSGARLRMDLEKGAKMRDYLRTVDFGSGEICVYWTDERGEWLRKGFVSRERFVHVQKLVIPEGVRAELVLRLEPFNEEGEHKWEKMSLPEGVLWKAESEQDAIVFEGFYDREVSPEGYAVVVWTASPAETEPGPEGSLFVRAEGELLIGSAIRHFETYVPGCGRKVLEEARAVLEAQGYAGLLEEQRASHGKLMGASVLELAGAETLATTEELLAMQHEGQGLRPELLEKMYDAGRFFQIVNTGELPPMIGQWNINVNLQVCGANITGMPELMKPYFAFIEKNLPDFRRNAREIFGCRGIVADIHPDLHNGLLYHFSRTWPHEFYTAGTGWMYHEFYYYYLCTGDRVFLKEHVVPGLKEIAAFYCDFLTDTDADGNYLFYPCLSPENNPVGHGPATVNAVMDLMVCREVLENLIQAVRTLGLKEPEMARWEEMLAKLPPLLTDEEGGLKEWAWVDYEENYNHRCVSHHYGVWPADQITFEETPELARAVWISNRKRPLENDSCHGVMHRLFTAIRLGDREYTGRLLHMLFEYGFVNPNLTTNHYPYRVVFPDMLGSMPAVIAEMMVYAKPGRVKLLPGVRNLIPAGKIKGLWLYTFLKIREMEWDLEEGWMRAELAAIEGQEVTVGFGETVRACRVDGKEVELDGGSFVLKVEKGQEVVLEAVFGG